VRALLLLALALHLGGQDATVLRFALADCDDVVFGPGGDLFFACHSPSDDLGVTVRGAKAVPDVMDAYVLRVRLATGEIVYATRIGGSSFDAALRVAVDRRGFAYATGLTKSRDFPLLPGDGQNALRGPSDAFLVTVSPSGELVRSQLIGGSGDEVGNALVVTGDGAVYLGGSTSSIDFGRPREKGGDDAFVCRVRQTARGGTECVSFGGDGNEKLTGLASDGRGALYAAGFTGSRDFPLIRPFQSRMKGTGDAFLTRLSVPSLKVTFSTVFGGSGDDSAWGVAADRRGRVFLAGITNSDDLPGAQGAYQPRRRGDLDAFVAVFSGRGHRRVRATYFGGTSRDESGYDGGSIQVAPDGTVWLAGITASSDLPTTRGTYGAGGTDGFVAAFDRSLRRLCFAGVYGGRERNLLEAIAVRPGAVVATGVSFRDSPGEHHVQVGPGVYAGHTAIVLSGRLGCAK
jgi:hypothetical protein